MKINIIYIISPQPLNPAKLSPSSVYTINPIIMYIPFPKAILVVNFSVLFLSLHKVSLIITFKGINSFLQIIF